MWHYCNQQRWAHQHQWYFACNSWQLSAFSCCLIGHRCFQSYWLDPTARMTVFLLQDSSFVCLFWTRAPHRENFFYPTVTGYQFFLPTVTGYIRSRKCLKCQPVSQKNPKMFNKMCQKFTLSLHSAMQLVLLLPGLLVLLPSLLVLLLPGLLP